MRAALSLLLLVAAACSAPSRHLHPVTGPTPQTAGDMTTMIQKAMTIDCEGGQTAGSDSWIYCKSEPGKPKFFFRANNAVECETTDSHADENCKAAWTKLTAQ